MPERIGLNRRNFLKLGSLAALTVPAVAAAGNIAKGESSAKQPDLSVFKRFDFKYSPIGIHFALKKPDQIPPIRRKAAFCEMIKIAQQGESFYAAKDDHECKAALIPLGLSEPDPIFSSGQIGPKLGVYDNARANRNIYANMYKVEKDTVKFVVFAPLDKLSFNPDLLIITADPRQAEIILRAMSYRTGAAWSAKGTTVMGCVYLYLYPYITGELNMMVTGLHHGMIARQLFPEGLLFLSIPYQIIPETARNLEEMEWDLPQYSGGKEAHIERMKKISNELHEEFNVPGSD
ncbi:MAG: DUF169 domain-containing protein [Acidobacteria bacterium]|nr:DUF169 domain-containing protein [Acidobacteriota bacterium]